MTVEVAGGQQNSSEEQSQPLLNQESQEQLEVATPLEYYLGEGHDNPNLSEFTYSNWREILLGLVKVDDTHNNTTALQDSCFKKAWNHIRTKIPKLHGYNTKGMSYATNTFLNVIVNKRLKVVPRVIPTRTPPLLTEEQRNATNVHCCYRSLKNDARSRKNRKEMLAILNCTVHPENRMEWASIWTEFLAKLDPIHSPPSAADHAGAPEAGLQAEAVEETGPVGVNRIALVAHLAIDPDAQDLFARARDGPPRDPARQTNLDVMNTSMSLREYRRSKCYELLHLAEQKKASYINPFGNRNFSWVVKRSETNEQPFTIEAPLANIHPENGFFNNCEQVWTLFNFMRANNDEVKRKLDKSGCFVTGEDRESKIAAFCNEAFVFDAKLLYVALLWEEAQFRSSTRALPGHLGATMGAATAAANTVARRSSNSSSISLLAASPPELHANEETKEREVVRRNNKRKRNSLESDMSDVGDSIKETAAIVARALNPSADLQKPRSDVKAREIAFILKKLEEGEGDSSSISSISELLTACNVNMNVATNIRNHTEFEDEELEEFIKLWYRVLYIENDSGISMFQQTIGCAVGTASKIHERLESLKDKTPPLPVRTAVTPASTRSGRGGSNGGRGRINLLGMIPADSSSSSSSSTTREGQATATPLQLAAYEASSRGVTTAVNTSSTAANAISREARVPDGANEGSADESEI